MERSIIVSVRNVEEGYLSLPDMNCVTNVPEEKETVINKSSCGPTRELVGVTSNLTGGLRDLASGGLKVFRHGLSLPAKTMIRRGGPIKMRYGKRMVKERIEGFIIKETKNTATGKRRNAT